MFTDTHAHLYSKKFEGDRDDMIQRAFDAGITTIVMPAIDVQSVHDALSLCARHSGLYAMAALHPSETKTAADADFQEIESFCSDPKVVAVGESGLDYYWDTSFNDRQHDFLRRHISLAMDKDLPLILHNRQASDDLIRILKEEKSAAPEKSLRGIFHCFGGKENIAPDVMDLGFHVGIGGTLTFKNSGVADSIESVPLERIVLETDAPYLAPVPFRGKRNESAYMRHVAEELARLRSMDLLEIAAITTDNANRLFRLQET